MTKYFIFFGVTLAVRSPASPVSSNPQCYTSQLKLPENGKGWDCTGASNIAVNIRDRCTAVCEENYRLELLPKSRDYQICKYNIYLGAYWLKPERYRVQCVPDYKKEINALIEKIEQNEDENRERWVALLNSDPIQHVTDFKWATPPVADGMIGHLAPLLVNIGGIWGTVCYDDFDEAAAEFFCRNLEMPGAFFYDPLEHKDVQDEYGEYPVLLTNVKCTEGADSVHDCTSGPMGYAYCSSGQDLVLGCGYDLGTTQSPWNGTFFNTK